MTYRCKCDIPTEGQKDVRELVTNIVASKLKNIGNVVIMLLIRHQFYNQTPVVVVVVASPM